MYFAFINSRISYGIEVYGHCADEHLSKLQTLQNKLLKLMLKLDRRTSTNQLHRNLSLLKVSDMHTVSVLCFVNICRAARCPDTFCNHYQVRQTERELRNKDHLDVPWARTDTLQLRHNGLDSVSNHQPHDWLLKRLFRRRSKKTPKLRVTGLCAGNSPEAGEFPTQRTSNAENVSIWWRHHDGS